LPTSPIDDAGPLNGKTPPILISVAVTPGASAANDGVDSASTSVQASLNFPNKTSSLAGNARSAPATRVGSTRRGRCGRPACGIDYSSFLELVKRFRKSTVRRPLRKPAIHLEKQTYFGYGISTTSVWYCRFNMGILHNS
jgi:hypothetical protein